MFGNTLVFHKLEFWLALLCVVIFRLIGYKEGQHELTKNLIEQSHDITVNVINDNFELVTCELKDIPNGLSFSLVNDKTQTKLIKCTDSADGCATCWNSSTDTLNLVNTDSNCIVYKTRNIYVPLVKMKEMKK
jgi:hypothetical protein